MPIIPHIGVVFSYMRSLSLDRYHFLFLDNFEGNTNISVTIKSASMVYHNFLTNRQISAPTEFDGMRDGLPS